MDDVRDTVFDNLRLWTLVDTVIEEVKELLEGGVVAPVDQRDLNDAEIEDCFIDSHKSVLLTPVSDFMMASSTGGACLVTPEASL